MSKRKDPNEDVGKAKPTSPSANGLRVEAINSIAIPRYRVRGTVVEYLIECTGPKSLWQVCRRYQHFKLLHQQLLSLCAVGSAHHCDYGIVPSLIGTSWTESTNSSPELVERRRRHLEIYLQQLLVPRNEFYNNCAPLVHFLHDDEMPIVYQSKMTKLIPGLAHGTEDDIKAPALEDDDLEKFLENNSESDKSEEFSQWIGARPEFKPLATAIAPSIPDLQSSSVNKTHADKNIDKMNTAENKIIAAHQNESGMADESQKCDDDLPHEKCDECGATTVVDYDISEWQSYGRCESCGQYATHTIIEDSNGETRLNLAADETLAPGQRPEGADIAIKDTKQYSTSGNGFVVPAEIDAVCCSSCGKIIPAYETPLTCSSCSATSVCSDCWHGEVCANCNPPPISRDSLTGFIRKAEGVALSEFGLITTLGRGTFGKVMKVCFKPSGKIYAMKALNKVVVHQRRMIDYIKEEKSILASISDHPFVCKLHYAFQTDHHIFLILDFLPGGELYAHIQPVGRVPEDVARFYTCETVLALQHIHQHDICHRDLKPENLVLDHEGHVKLTDFGLARKNFSRTRRRSFVGSAEYLSPETIRNEVQTKALDWWGLGVMLYEMLIGKTPFHAATNNAVYAAVVSRPVNLSFSHLSKEAIDLISQLLDKNPRTRLSDPKKIKEHPWFRGIDWSSVYRREMKPPFVPDLTSNDTKYFSKEFTSEWATIQKPGVPPRTAVELLTQRFSNFQLMPEEVDSETAARNEADKAAEEELRRAKQVEEKGQHITSNALIPHGMAGMIDPQLFYGLWRLLRVEMRSTNGQISFPWGAEVGGLLIYTDTGLFSWQLCPLKRSRPKDKSKLQRDEMADYFACYSAAFGSYNLLPGKPFIYHRVTMGLNPVTAQMVQRRKFEFNGKLLSLSTTPYNYDDKNNIITRTVWEKVVAKE